MRRALIEAIARMSEEEAVALWDAVAQWADNERNGIDESSRERERMRLRAAEAIERAGEGVLVKAAR